MNYLLKNLMKFSFILILICFHIVKINCNNIIGCGGFIKSELKEFSYQKLSAHLTFIDGTVNYVTDILPNGAYSIPIYDFGTYIIKIVGPKGWNIEPVEGYRLVINSQESCSDDYNFNFAGFSIFGKVTTAYINHGPSGIFIDLVNNSQIISQTTTIDGGDFTINKVIPGNYSLHFKSETSDGKALELNDTYYRLEVKDENVYIKDSFIIYGYPVFGDVKFYEEPIKDVEFFIFSNIITVKTFNFSRYKCLRFDESIFNIDGYNALCKTISNSKGEFMFPLLPGGTYLIVPKYQTNVSTYDLYPANYAFEITSNSIDLRSIFKIIGFSVIGKVITFNGNPISNAQIHVDGNLLGKTDIGGNFSLKGVNKGTHEISVLLDGYIFNRTTVNFNPKSPNLGIFSPEKISICGSIVIENTKSIEKEITELSIRRKILLINATSGDIVDHVYTQMQDSKINSVDKNIICTFCFFSKPGLYIVKPIMDSSVSMLSLAPNKVKILLDSSPVIVKFSPFRGSISGAVKCIEKCNAGEFEVTLKLKDENIESVQLTQHISISNELTNQGSFQFKDIIPGSYQIELISANSHIPLHNNRWCWSQTIITVDIVDNNVKGLIFEQIGFSLPIQSSHDLKINYFHLNKSFAIIESKNLSKGLSQICLPKSGKYEIQVDTCYKLENNSYFIDPHQICEFHFDFRNPMCHLKINVVEFKVRADFELMENGILEDLKTNIKGTLNFNSNSTIKNITWNDNKGYLDFWIKPDINVNVSVNSTKYLVKPKKISFQLPKDTFDCLTKIGTFRLESGTFINGIVSPALKTVIVEIRQKVSSLDEDDIEHIVGFSETNENGQFSFGPLNSSFKYELKLSKNGYKIVENKISENNYHFNAYKLAELVVEVVENVTGKALAGILLSIIGNDLRKNELTNEDGKYIFVGLTPGVYYLRAMMKELEFFPRGAVEVVIVEGSVEKILIKAARTSFSLHGKVISLNGEPESGVIIEGDPIKDFIEADYQLKCKKNLIHNEHATTDETGTFRIRGLQPECYYKLSLKNVNINEDNAIIRSYPKNMIIKMQDKDVHNIKIYALRNVNIREISAMVWTNQEIHQASLHLLVFPSDNPDNVITAHKFNNEGIYFQMSLPQVHKRVEYVIRLQSNLNPSLYSNISAQEKTLTIEAGETKSIYKHFEFHFYPVKKSIGESDITMTLSSSLILPFLIITLSVVFFKRDSFEPLIYKIFKMVKLCFNTYKHTNIALPPGGVMKSSILDAVEITELNNVIAKPKSAATLPPVKKIPFWSRPKKA